MIDKIIFKSQKIVGGRLYLQGETVNRASLPVSDEKIEEYEKDGYLTAIRQKGFVELDEDVVEKMKPDIVVEEKRQKQKEEKAKK